MVLDAFLGAPEADKKRPLRSKLLKRKKDMASPAAKKPKVGLSSLS